VNSLNFCKIYKQVLIFFLLLPPLCFSATPPTTHRQHFPGLPAAPSPLFLRHLALARPPAARPTPLAPPRMDASRRYPPEPPRALWTTSSCLPSAPVPLFGFGTHPVNFFLLLFPHAHPNSCSLLRSTTSPELLCAPPSSASAAPPL
jgi:hypothetical protein